jgi:hypothetical protein
MNDRVNIPLLRKVVEWAEVENELTQGRTWYQGIWFGNEDYIAYHISTNEISGLDITEVFDCGTVMCLAGKIAFDAGWEPNFDGANNAGSVVRDGHVRDVEEVACELLGIDMYATDLFDGDNTVEQIRYIAEDLAGEPL